MREEILQQLQTGVKQVITNEYKGRFFSGYVLVTCFIQA